MIDKDSLRALLKELDEQLCKQQLKRSITIYGGAALIALDILDRATYDIDVFQPQIDDDFRKAISEVGKRHLFDDLWINSTGAAFVKKLPEKWQARTVPFYLGSCLTVYHLGRSDLLFTKLLAELDRQDDLPDIIRLKPKEQELLQAQKCLLKLDADKDWQAEVKKPIRKLIHGS